VTPLRTTIEVVDLRVTCLIGCLDPERKGAQTIRVDLAVEVDAGPAADGDDLRRTWDYAAISREVGFILRAGRFHLLETAARFLLRWLLLPPQPGEGRPQASRASVTLTKFNVLPGEALARVSLASGSPDGGADSATGYTVETNPWGTVDVVDECRRIGLYRLNVAPGQSIPNHYHQRMREAELILTPGLVGWREGEAEQQRAVGDTFHWAKNEEHGYRNVRERSASILCVDSPPFDPSDEVEA